MTTISKCFQNLLILLFIGGNLTNAAQILALFPSVWTSHYIFGREILLELAARGHNITVVYNGRQNLPKLKNNNYTEIVIKDDHDDWPMSFKFNEIREKSTLELFTRMIYTGTSSTAIFMENENIQKLLKSDIKFDLLIGDLFLSDALFGFSHIFKCPTIVIGPTGINKWLSEISGNPHNSAYNPSIFLQYLEEMSLGQRIINTLMCTFEKLTYNFFHIMYQDTLYQKYFNTPENINLPILKDLILNTSLILLNSNPLVQYPNAFLPNLIEIGGAHLRNQNYKDLPKDIYEFIETSPKDVILITFGATLKTIDLPKDKFEALLNALNFLKNDIRVILKWEKYELPNKPENVLIKKWLPQQQILAHPKVKLLISSGGLMSYFEAIRFETPILGIPIFPEQEVNLKRIEKLGCGKKLEYEKFTTENLIFNIQEILNNSKYHENIIRVSQLLETTKLNKPLDLSIYYIELILKTKGDLQLKSFVYNKLGFLQSEIIDVLLIIITGISIIITVPSVIICIILRRSNNNNNINNFQSNNNNINVINSNGQKLFSGNIFERIKFKESKKKLI